MLGLFFFIRERNLLITKYYNSVTSPPPTLQSQEKEKMHESNVSQLQLTVDWMLNEARERQKTYSNEKKQLIDDKVYTWQENT